MDETELLTDEQLTLAQRIARLEFRLARLRARQAKPLFDLGQALFDPGQGRSLDPAARTPCDQPIDDYVAATGVPRRKVFDLCRHLRDRHLCRNGDQMACDRLRLSSGIDIGPVFHIEEHTITYRFWPGTPGSGDAKVVRVELPAIPGSFRWSNGFPNAMRRLLNDRAADPQNWESIPIGRPIPRNNTPFVHMLRIDKGSVIAEIDFLSEKDPGGE